MKLVTYLRNEEPRLGAVIEDRIIDLADLAAAAGEKLPADMRRFIEESPAALERAKALVAKAGNDWPAGVATPLGGAKLLAPLANPPKGVIGVGLNYAEHVAEASRTMDTAKELPSHPVLFIMPPNAIIGPDDGIIHNPSQTQQLDWEAELGAVIGKRARNVSRNDAMDYVFGYTCINDVSARDLRHGGQWCFAKGQDSYCPMGPWIVTADEIADPHNLNISLKLNGEYKQNSNTRHMIFKIPDLIAHLTSGITLQPGDVIATGTPEGVGISYNPPQFMKAGDKVEIEIENVGKLNNVVVAG